MLIFALVILISIVMFIYYKVMILRTSDRLNQVYFNSKAKFFLGTFLISFGINQYLAYQLTFVLIISLIFIGLGSFQSYHGFKAARHYRREWKRLNE
ncbi:MAG TPA: YtpI family protein [Pseudogracilibacillus sp.]|nr:YtpI family protein [Pseudogracilibacillus sp.]